MQFQSDVYSSSQRTIGVDSDLTTIRKKELQDMRDELDQLKEEVTRINEELKGNELARQELIDQHRKEIESIK